MKILVSNDDGAHATGIKFLFSELEFNHEVVMIAPNKERSSCGHGITLGEPIRLNKIANSKYECSGYPADCILIGVGHHFSDQKPDLVVSGINHGANLGQDRFYSGTIAAAREAAFREIPSIAVSLVTKSIKDVEHFDVAAKFVNLLISKGVRDIIPPMALLNINVPNIPMEEISGVKLTTSGMQLYSEEVVERVDTRGRNYYWVGGTYQGSADIKGSDCNAVAQSLISVELQSLSVNDSDKSARSKLEELLKEINHEGLC